MFRYKAANPKNVSPCVKYQGQFLLDSIPIIQTIDKATSSTLNLPESEAAKELLTYVDTQLVPSLGKTLMNPQPPVQKEEIPKVMEGFKKLNAVLAESKGPFLLGEKITVIDIVIMPHIVRVPYLKYFRYLTLKD
jgi:glutathione S-transferase